MLAARDQENLVARRQNGAALKQQNLGARYPKTPVKIPLNDENASHITGGAKSILGNRTRGNENAAPTTKGLKGLDKSKYVTPMGPRSRAVLGDKTTNAKAKGQQSINVKNTTRDTEKSQVKAPTTVRPKQKQPQAETQKLQIHAEESDPLSEEEPEYCPPRPKDLPFESDVFPNGVLTFEGLKEENLFKGYYDYYVNPIDENGVRKGDRELAERNRKAMEELDRRVQQDMDEFDWSVSDVPETKDYFKKNRQKAQSAEPVKAKGAGEKYTTRKPLSTITSRNAAHALTMDDATKSMQRKVARAIPVPAPKRKAIHAIPGLRATHKPAVRPTIAKKTPMEARALEVNSRATIGHNKGRAVASVLTKGTKGTINPSARRGHVKSNLGSLSRSATTASHDSDKTITPARFAHKQVSAADEDEEWKERVPFLSIFNPNDDDDDDIIGSGFPGALEDDDDFQMQLPE